MLRRFNRLLWIFFIVAVSLYTVILNRESLTLHLWPGTSVTTSAGVILIGVFCLGILCTAMVALFFGMKAWFREKALLGREKQRQSFYQSMVEARSFLAAGEFGKAADSWQQIVRRDPANVVARLELSKCLEGAGDIKEAARILDAARTASPGNIEVLFRAAQLNLAQGNKTAAIDNLALVLYHHPVRKAAIMARNLSEELGRFDDALEYQKHLDELGGEEDPSRTVARIQYRKLIQEMGSVDAQALIEALEKFVKQYREYAPAMIKLAELRKAEGDIEAAARWLVKAAGAGMDARTWQEVMKLWLAEEMPEKALAAARAATKDSHGEARLEAELNLLRLHLLLNMTDEARRILDGFAGLAREQGAAIMGRVAFRLLVLKALYHGAIGDQRGLAPLLNQLADWDFENAAEPIVTPPAGDSPSLTLAPEVL